MNILCHEYRHTLYRPDVVYTASGGFQYGLTFATSDRAASSMPMFSLADVSNHAWKLFSLQ